MGVGWGGGPTKLYTPLRVVKKPQIKKLADFSDHL